MKRTIYIAVVQPPMASLDCTFCEVFNIRENAEHWIGEMISDSRFRNGYTEEEMNTEIYEREIYL